VTLADQAIERDRARKGGWDFVDPAHRFIELFGAACASARNGALARARRSDCACTRTLAEIETHKRSLLLLIQASSALSTCSSQQQELCVQGNGQSWWQVMGNSLARALTDSAFDELEFGLRLYPSVQTQCSVAATPEVLPSKDAEVPALRALLGLPGGSAALLAGMEQVARETEPASAGEERILLVIGNGNDGCSGLASSELTARLSAAADRLAQAGVRIYPVLVAQGSDLIAASDNLRAIARPPGLGALGADAGVPYLDGADPNALPKLLGRVVHELDTCSLRLSTLKPEHDRKLVRLFLAGEALERDETQKNQGWGWKNAAAGEIDLYGEACRRFKELGVAQITAEIGC
jgi:hypothetical protein